MVRKGLGYSESGEALNDNAKKQCGKIYTAFLKLLLDVK